MSKRRRRNIVQSALLALSCLAVASAATAQDAQSPLVPESFELTPVAKAAIDAEWLTEEERSQRRIFHGVWDQRDLLSPAHEAQVALEAWDFGNPSLSDPLVPSITRAEALFRQGEMEAALELLQGDDSLPAIRITAEAQELLGNREPAIRAAERAVARLEATDDAADLTAAVGAMLVRARLEGQPARDYQAMMKQLGRARQQLDRLYWPATLAEAQLLIDKDNEPEAIATIHETLRLNPRCSEAWYELGRLALNRFDFSSAAVAISALRRQNPEHPLAILLHAESRLIQDDPDDALAVLAPLTESLPRFRPARDLVAAGRALTYDEPSMREALATCDQLSPGSARPYAVVGRHLSLQRQYEAAAEILEEAIRRQPAWPQPQIELGLMELQSGREAKARAVLQRVIELDPFNKRAANSFFLLEEMAAYKEVETEHFIIRYQPGIDEVLVTMMPEKLEEIHATVSSRFDFEPPQKTTIEVMPDHRRFAVRITGMPWIHTVAACTGPVIALEVPREGRMSEHLGLFDWPRVIQHEYTHTVTLAQTRNRIPHWLTEAAAVSMEKAPRDYDTCVMLARAYQEGTLFDLDEIKWAFIRPKQPGDRSKAYAQGHWMVQYMDERFGSSALIRLLDRYFQGDREREAIPLALGVSREAFFEGFHEWAGEQVKAWGLDARPSMIELTDSLRWSDPELSVVMRASQQARLDAIVSRLTDEIGRPASPRTRALKASEWPELVRPPISVTEERLDEWLEQYPDHPDLVELQLRRHLSAGDGDPRSLVPELERYAALRPVDPLPHKKLAEIWLASDTPERAIEHLERLDQLEDKSPVYAVKLSKLYRAQGERSLALEKATRALHINPYSAADRELAAALAIENRDLTTARGHIAALTLLEPDRPQHLQRLEAIDRMMGERQ